MSIPSSLPISPDFSFKVLKELCHQVGAAGQHVAYVQIWQHDVHIKIINSLIKKNCRRDLLYFVVIS